MRREHALDRITLIWSSQVPNELRFMYRCVFKSKSNPNQKVLFKVGTFYNSTTQALKSFSNRHG